jgi:hypothetical protein
MYYTPQVIAVHGVLERQNFRRGDCSSYSNPVLYIAPDFIMPTIMIKRLTTGAAPTVTLVDLYDTDIFELTPDSVVNWPLDDLGEYEMMVLSGSFAGTLSLQDGGKYYLRIEAGAFVYYTDEFILSYDDGGFPIGCGENWTKITWVINGSCIVSGKTDENEAEPVHGYPITPISQFFFWNANLSRPEWEYEVKGEDDAHGVQKVETQKLVKRWNLEGVPITESLYDAITTASLADLVAIEFVDGTVLAGVKDILTEVVWEGGGCLASVKATFSTDYFVKQGCC